jgi:hypothetical protein
MGCYGYGCSNMFFPVVEIHMSNRVFRCMVVRITFIFVIFNLETSGYTLPTEGNFISSRATGNCHWHEIQLVGFNNVTHHLSQRNRCRMVSMK